MKRLLILSVIVFSISCSSSDLQTFEFKQGKLDEISEGFFALEKNEETQYIYVTQTLQIDGNTIVVSSYNDRLQFYDSNSGKLIKEITFDKEGPNALKGGMSAVFAIDMDTIVAASHTGNFGLFVNNQKLKEIEFTTPMDGLFRAVGNHGNMRRTGPDSYQFGMFPMGAFKDNAPVGFTDWYLNVDLATEEQKAFRFSAPAGYDDFLAVDAMAAVPVMAYDSKRNLTHITFPYSDSLFVFEREKLIKKVELHTNQKFNYLPYEKLVTERFTAFRPQKDGAIQLNLIYDPHREILIRLLKVKESGDSDNFSERKHHYALNIYNSTYDLLAEYTFEFDAGSQLSNYFITEKGLFLNAADQESDDYYQFYHINLDKAISND